MIFIFSLITIKLGWGAWALIIDKGLQNVFFEQIGKDQGKKLKIVQNSVDSYLIRHLTYNHISYIKSMDYQQGILNDKSFNQNQVCYF